MNAQTFQKVEQLAESMMVAAEADDESAFYALYDQLKSMCETAKGTSKDHPVLWETLGDFSEEFTDAITAYEQAFNLAKALKDNEYKASIQLAIAQRYLEENDKNKAQEMLESAEKFAGFTEDNELQSEIAELKRSL